MEKKLSFFISKNLLPSKKKIDKKNGLSLRSQIFVPQVVLCKCSFKSASVIGTLLAGMMFSVESSQGFSGSRPIRVTGTRIEDES